MIHKHFQYDDECIFVLLKHDEEVDGKGDARQSLKRKRSKEVGDDGDGKKNKKEKK